MAHAIQCKCLLDNDLGAAVLHGGFAQWFGAVVLHIREQNYWKTSRVMIRKRKLIIKNRKICFWEEYEDSRPSAFLSEDHFRHHNSAM